MAFELGVVEPGTRAGGPEGAAAVPQRETLGDKIPARPLAAPPSGASPIKGPAARLVANMTESLSVPTATTFRTIAVATLESRRKELNARLQTAGRKEKLSFTHLIGFALIQAAKRHPVMSHTLLLQDGVPYRVQPDGIGLGLAVDVQRKDGSRGLVVPVIKRADTMDFGAFHAAYEALVEKARANQLMPDDFTGSTIQLTNPGGLGTVASVPRLMVGQGSIIAVGAIGYPAEFSTVPEERLRELGVSKVMTATSTYDHRVIQGAESGAFLATLDHLLGGEDHFYETVAESLQLSAVSYHLAPAATQLPKASEAVAPEMLYHVGAAMALVKAFRTHGHLAAHTDPLGTEPLGDPALDLGPLGLTPEIMASIPSKVLRVYVPGRTLAESYRFLQQTYCGTMAYQVEHISSHLERVWLREKIESGAFRTPLSAEEKKRLLGRLTKVEALERFLHKAYLGHKRFSIEGVDMLVPMLDLTFELAASTGAREVVIGMAHRGRLNVLAHTIGRPYETIFAEFEGGRFVEGNRLTPEGGTGDVKYHHGAEGAFPLGNGKSIAVTLSPNPSHLEFVSPVVDGRARATQTLRKGRAAHHDPAVALPVLIHGDAAFAAQGVVAETLNLSALAGYRVGGTLHIITNNQVGFTTGAEDARSTRYASDLAKGFDVPIIHVNSDDPEACLAAIRLAMAYREKFRRDVLIDLVGYRRHGHNESDEPTYTQPLMYERIKQLPPVRARYAEQLAAEGVVTQEEAAQQAEAAYQRLADQQQRFKASLGKGQIPEPPKPTGPGHTVVTAVAPETLTALNEQLLTWPAGFTDQPQAQEATRTAANGGRAGRRDRLGARRNARARVVGGGGRAGKAHGAGHGAGHLQPTAPGSARREDRAAAGPDSAPSRGACPARSAQQPAVGAGSLGFEYGYSAEAAEALVLWEGQFGDFINSGQVIVDQFLSAGLSKWGLTARLCLLLPHGYEGQGPEHSSARLERFLQLCAEGNIRVANPTTPAQYFHLLRRQARRTRQRPLIIMTPKSLLRHPQAASRLEDLAEGSWRPVFDDPWATDERASRVTRLVFCSGKLFYELLAEAEKLSDERPALIRLEQLYSFPWPECRQVLARYPGTQQLIWAQEEPRNMGAWTYLEPKLRELLPQGAELRYVGRPERASPAEGYPAAHLAEQSRIVGDALGIKQPRLSRETVVTAGEGQG